MRTGWMTMGVLAALVLALGPANARAPAAAITIGARANAPDRVEIRAGEAVEWVNASGGTAHVWFGPEKILGFYVGRDRVRVQFDRPGSYDYLVHLTIGASAHSHPGAVVVK
jgi:plastocyanin